MPPFLKLIFGKLDNYGGRTAEAMIWLREERCIGNNTASGFPKSNAASCNRSSNPDNFTQKPIDWVTAQKAQGAPIDTWWLDDTAHGTFVGPLLKNMVTYTNGSTRFAWVGGSPAARRGLLNVVAELLKQRRPE